MIKFLLSNFPISRQADDPPLAFGISVITPPCDPGHDKSVHLLISIERLPGRVVADLRPVFTLMSQELLAAMRQSVIDGATDRAVEAARQALASGVDPLEAIEKGFVPGMDFVGAQFAKHAMFFPDLVMAGEAMKAGVGAIEPELQKQGGHRQFAGKVVLGSARGDIHEIGKCLVGVLLAANGFQVYDLGTSVTPESFLAKAKEVDADIVGISALLTTTMAGQRAVVQAFERDGLRPRVQIIVGGAPVTRGWAQEIGADGYAPDAVATVVLVKSLMKKIFDCNCPSGEFGRGLNSAGYKNLPFYFSCEVAVRPKVELLDRALIERILGEAFQLLEDHGIRVGAPEVCELLRAAGARVENEVAHLPQLLARKALSSVPAGFWLYDRAGNRTVHYGGSDVHFDPGSSCVQIFDSETNDRRAAISSDLIRLVQLAEVLPQYAAQSTAVVCSDVPCEIGDLYRLFLVLWYSEKPVVTGAFSAEGLRPMLDLLAAERGGYAELSQKPRAVFDVCPSPPLNWSEFGALNLIRLARAGVPAEIIPMPLAGATAPVTLVGSVVQHAAECIAGITIHQLAQPAAPVVWGGAPAIFDMRTGTTPVGAIESIMLNLACAEVGRYLGLPTHAYLLGTDSKLIDAQAGLETGMAAVLGALSGINMISGAGMLDSLACHSLEKLVIDAEAIASAHRLAAGLKSTDSPLATATFAQVGIRGEFLKLNETRTLFRNEQYLPSAVIDRDSLRAWQDSSAPDTLMRAGRQACELLASYQRKSLAAEVESEVLSFMSVTCAKAGMSKLAGIDDHSLVAAPAETVHH